MIKRENKKGLSPVIATVLLIGISLAIAIIIFLWARAYIGEKTIKFDSPVEEACDDVEFDAEIIDGVISIENTGNIPLYGVELRKKENGIVLDVGKFTKTISTGESGNILTSEVESGDEVIVVPVILGEIKEVKKAHTCDEDYGLDVIAE